MDDQQKQNPNILSFMQDASQGMSQDGSGTQGEYHDVDKLKMVKQMIISGDVQKALTLLDECIGEESQEPSADVETTEKPTNKLNFM